jgi:two-component system sensor histidine kinase RegB
VLSGFHHHLLQLTYIRTLVLFAQSGALLFALFVLHLTLDVWLLGSTLAALALLNVMTFARLHSRWPVTELEFFSQLCADVVLYGCLLYQSGGATNPFIFMLLIPLLVSAATLSARYTLLMAAMLVVLYTSLLRHYIPVLELEQGHQHRILNLYDLHITGMWINFLFTVLLISWFILRMQQTLKGSEQRLQTEREQHIRDQQLLALATLAAGTAHELGTPLSTMQVTLREMELDHPNDPQLLDDIALLRQQVSACSERLQQMSRGVQEEQQRSHRRIAITELLQRVIEEWTLMRPDVSYRLHSLPRGSAPRVSASAALQQALLNLFNNAADANPEGIEIKLDWDSERICLQLHDQGPGLPLEQADQLGKPFVTTKGRGLGIGLFLTSSTLARHQGEVRLYNHPDGGTLTEVILPIGPAAAEGAEP